MQAAVSDDEAQFERRRDALLARLPARIGRAAHWLLAPGRRWVRVPSGCLFLLGGMLWFLPLLGLWMLPLGVLLLAEDFGPFRRLAARLFGWIARRHPDWLRPAPARH